MTAFFQGLVILLCVIFALFVAVNFWPLLILFLILAVPLWVIDALFKSRMKKKKKK
jgi:1,4-dihydroxy-2-naphthoate octaprenyltransferase